MVGLFLKILLRYLFSGRFSTKFITAISILGSFLATTSLLLTIGIMNGFERAVKESLLDYLPHLTIFVHSKDEIPQVEKKVRGTLKGEVKEFFWYATFGAVLQNGRNLTGATLIGSEPKRLVELIKRRGDFIDGNLTSNGIALGTLLADRLNIYEVPKRITVINPVARKTPIGFLPRVKRVKVSGIYVTGYYLYDNAAVGDYKFLSQFLTPSGFYAVINVKDPYRVDDFKKKLSEVLGDYYITTWVDSNKEFFSSLQLEKLGMVLVVGLIGLVAAFNISSLLFTKVRELSGDFAIFRAFGIGRGFIFSVVVSLGGFIGLIGSLLGIVFALITSYVANKYKLIQVPQEVYLTPYLPIDISLKNLLFVFLAVMLFSLLASILPAYSAVKERISDILRNE